jgi:hypothetical protein
VPGTSSDRRQVRILFVGRLLAASGAPPLICADDESRLADTKAIGGRPVASSTGPQRPMLIRPVSRLISDAFPHDILTNGRAR